MSGEREGSAGETEESEFKEGNSTSSPKHEKRETLPYTIQSCSSYSVDFVPENIMVDRPQDQKSRWLSGSNRSPQYIVLKLERPAVVMAILFGKYKKSHPCNLRKFSVYGGMECSRLHLLCEGGLADNAEPEQFSLRYEVDNRPFPCQFIKLVPLQSWSPTFAFSIWYVELQGVSQSTVVEPAEQWLTQRYKHEALRLCMKHLRDNEFSEAYNSLRKHSRVELEHPVLSELHSVLVDKGDFLASERIMQQAAEDGFLDSYISQQPIEAKWTPISPTSTEKPGMRGGHQMCIDPDRELLYLFGGWDGSTDLCDLWQFSLESNQWQCLCSDTSLEGGPKGRSCHKMCLDVDSQVLYLLGHYLDPSNRTQLQTGADPCPLPGDFYSYAVETRHWQLLSSDTHRDGGPHLIYDHQMAFDTTAKVIYVFGGRVLTSSYAVDSSQLGYSGLYSYNTHGHLWNCIRPDFTGGVYPNDFIPRMAHTLLLHPVTRVLYVMGGQRDKVPLSDMMTFDLHSKKTRVLANGKDTHIPASGFTLRTTLDTHRNEIHLLTGLNKFDDTSDWSGERGTCSNSLWIYNIAQEKWTCIFTGCQGPWSQSHSRLPAPRYAHQFVFDPKANCHYMFGGNPGSETAAVKPENSMRLDDFWRLKLARQSKAQLLRHCQLIIRKQCFAELVQKDVVKALDYLQTSIAALVNHCDRDESLEFRQLTTSLFSPTPKPLQHHSSPEHVSRQALYSQLSFYFPEHMSQPRHSILDMVQI